ncbi:hypothetical protein [Oribacterium sp.]
MIGLIGVIFASNGLFQLILYILQSKEKERERKRQEELEKNLIKVEDFKNLCACVTGIALFRITREAKKHIANGYITLGDLNTLKHHLYEPYRKLGGNGEAQSSMEVVEELPVRNE